MRPENNPYNLNNREMTEREIEQIIALLKREVVPAIGCTEPVAVSLAVAKAREVLGCVPEQIQVYLSANVLKNAMGVGIPGTNMVGLPVAIALGALIGKSDLQLEVLKETNPEAVEASRKMIEEKRIHVELKEGIKDKLYIEAICSWGDQMARVAIRGEHTNICHIEKNGRVCILEELQLGSSSDSPLHPDTPDLNLRKICDFAENAPIDKLRFILDSVELNKNAAIQSLKNNYGHALGKTILNYSQEKAVENNSFFRTLTYTSAACDARMAGAPIPVMSNSGSGNQGITATIPVVVYAEDTHQSEEKMIRALILSHLMVIYIKITMGRLSALCGCVVAATGSSCGITYLMGGKYKEISYAVKNMVANLTGMICDGAKPSCVLKVSSGVSTAMLSAMMAMEGKVVTASEGIIDEDVDKTIYNLAEIGARGMNETDRLVLQIMTCK